MASQELCGSGGSACPVHALAPGQQGIPFVAPGVIPTISDW